ncbi:MAG TPA: hypothetical protein VKY29_04000, partial [Cryomorphaceae bacterium]|nr:hypothetical protein [Cryomorphaceae bacterium]
MRFLIVAMLTLLPCFLDGGTLRAQNDGEPLTRILFVFDASNSMNATWQRDRKITVARKLLADAVHELNDKPNVEMALRVYGHQVAIAP